ncbi:DUF5115 domain-containing protein [Hoylesella oralis]|uniref:Outer membrane protein SusF domain-containing protein n=1 Tax=Hoylesella oralis TaxID=28134 RepID=UPI0028E80B6B|nr:DUF5115 domain-containing protein [Hoylesella oralis]
MKKQILYGFAVLAGFILASCNGDYDDWASPQSHQQEKSAAAYGVTVSRGANAVSVMPVDNDSLQLITFSSSDKNITGYTLRKLYIVTGNDTLTIEGSIVGNNIVVSASALDDALWKNAGTRKTTKYDFKVVTEFGANLANGDAVALTGESTGSLTTDPTPAEDANGYFMLGDFVENTVSGETWKLTKPINMNSKGNGIYEAVVETTKEGDNWFKFYGRSHYSATDWDEVNSAQMGCQENGDKTTPNFIIWSGDKYTVQTPVISGKGKWKVTLDAVNMIYKVEKYSTELYLTGSNYNWGAATTDWKKLTIVHSTENVFWTIIYLHANEEIKFAPQAGWGDDFGTEATIVDNAGAGAGGTGNIKIANAGWYLLKVTAGSNKTVEFLKPDVYLMGDAAGEWAIADSHKFSVPTTENGEFVSPQFAQNAEVRMCVSIGYDWWKTEFIVTADGKIDYRGNGDDQARVNVIAGQKAYLNFKTGTGRYQ